MRLIALRLLFALALLPTAVAGQTQTEWAVMSTPTTADLRGLYVQAANDVFAVGANGTALHYDGSAWTQMTFPDNSFLVDVAGFSATEVYALGAGNVYKYDGTSWAMLSPQPAAFFNPASLFAASWGTLYAAGSASPPAGVGGYAEFDGTTWTHNVASGVFDSPLRDIWGATADTLIAVNLANEVVVRCNNTWIGTGLGGTTSSLWGPNSKDVYIPTYGSPPSSVEMHNWNGSDDLCQTSWQGNNANKWTTRAVWGTSAANMFAVGSDWVFNGQNNDRYPSIYKGTTGNTWTRMSTPVDNTVDLELYAVHGSDSATVFAAGPGGVILKLEPSSPPDSLIVNTTVDAEDADTTDGVGNIGGPFINGRPPCSLRAAIQEANARPGADSIYFDIPTADPGYDPSTGIFTIEPLGAGLPPIRGQTIISGPVRGAITPLPAAGLVTGTIAQLVMPTIYLGGGQADSDADGLAFTEDIQAAATLRKGPGDGSRVENMWIGEWRAGIRIGQPDAKVFQCFIGVAPEVNRWGKRKNVRGIDVFARNAQIGAPDVGAQRRGNFITNSDKAIRVLGNGSGPADGSGTTIENNAIGDLATSAGIAVEDSSNIIGIELIDCDSVLVKNNQLFGNWDDGIHIEQGGYHVIQSNRIGRGSLTESFLNLSGIYMMDSVENLVGGTNTQGDSLGNEINGYLDGVYVGVSEPNQFLPVNTVVAGNIIGKRTQSSPLANRWGVEVERALGIVIGGETSGDRNVIAGNLKWGVNVVDLQPSANEPSCRVIGNYINVDETGTTGVVSGGGVVVSGSNNVLVGDSTSAPGVAPGNVIIGEGNSVQISSGARNRVFGNIIGLDVSGRIIPHYKGQRGVLINSSTENWVGAFTPGHRNVIAGVSDACVHITGGTDLDQFNRVMGNFLGLDATGEDYPEGAISIGFYPEYGVLVDESAVGTVVGGCQGPGEPGYAQCSPSPGQPPANVIAGVVTGVGVHEQFTAVWGNVIGLSASGQQLPIVDADDTFQGIGKTGVNVSADWAQIGGYNENDGNIVGGLPGGGIGINVVGTPAQYISLIGIFQNWIGLGLDGESLRAGGGTGIRLKYVSNSRIGDRLVGVLADSKTGNVVTGMRIGIDLEYTRSVLVAENIVGLTASSEETPISGARAGNEIGILLRASDKDTVTTNTIGGNRAVGAGIGLLITNTDKRSRIVSNFIGVKPTGEGRSNNCGVKIVDTVNQLIGGSDPVAPEKKYNLIQWNVEHGVWIEKSDECGIMSNSITKNGLGVTGKDNPLVYLFSNDLRNNDSGGLYFQSTDNLIVSGNDGVANGGNTGVHLNNANATITGNRFTLDASDAIALENGADAVIRGNLLFDNTGNGVNNISGATTVDAQFNWWGRADGPGGAGPGTGEEVTAGVDFSNWLTSPPDVVVFASPDTLYVPAGDTATALINTRNWAIDSDSLLVTITDDQGWLLGALQDTVYTSSVGGGLETGIAVPGGATPGAYSVVRATAASLTAGILNDVDSLLVVTYTPVLTAVRVIPDTVEVPPGDTLTFVAEGIDQYGGSIAFPNPAWSASDGTIESSGRYTAPGVVGTYTVTATDPGSQASDTAVVNVTGPALNLAVGVLQNPFLTQFIDIFVVASDNLNAATLQVTVDGNPVAATAVDAANNVWKADYELTGSGNVAIDACGESDIGVPACASASVSAVRFRPDRPLLISSTDGVFTLRAERATLETGRYVLVIPEANATTDPAHAGARTGYVVSAGDVARLGPVDVTFAYGKLNLGSDLDPTRLQIHGDDGAIAGSVIDRSNHAIRATANGSRTYSLHLGAPGSSRVSSPAYLDLAQNYPNPFNPTTTIRFDVDTAQQTRVVIYDVAGRRVATLFEDVARAGRNFVTWDGRTGNGLPAASGVYFVQVTTAHSRSSRKMVLLK